MLQNRTTVSRATVFAVAIAAGGLPFAAPAAAGVNSGPQVIRISEFQALRQSSAWNVLRSKLLRWKTLPLDWDGDDGIAPDEVTIAACTLVLEELENIGAPVPIASIAGDGEISYEWEKGDGFASMSLTADGHLIAFLREPGLNQPLRIDEPFEIDTMTPFLERIGAFA